MTTSSNTAVSNSPIAHFDPATVSASISSNYAISTNFDDLTLSRTVEATATNISDLSAIITEHNDVGLITEPEEQVFSMLKTCTPVNSSHAADRLSSSASVTGTLPGLSSLQHQVPYHISSVLFHSGWV